MDSKEGIEKVMPVDAQAVELLDTSLLRSGADDATMADPSREWVGSPVGSPTSPGETPRWESYCLYIRCCGTLMWSWNRIVKCQITAGMLALAKIFAKPRLEYCWVPSPWIC